MEGHEQSEAGELRPEKPLGTAAAPTPKKQTRQTMLSASKNTIYRIRILFQPYFGVPSALKEAAAPTHRPIHWPRSGTEQA